MIYAVVKDLVFRQLAFMSAVRTGNVAALLAETVECERVTSVVRNVQVPTTWTAFLSGCCYMLQTRVIVAIPLQVA